jgi:hypothetical protein
MTLMNAVFDVLSDPGWVLAQDGENWDPDPKTPKGLEGLMPKWIGWAKWVSIGVGILGLVACGIMMMIGRRNRSHLAAEGAAGLLWVVAGISVVALAGGTVPAMIGA